MFFSCHVRILETVHTLYLLEFQETLCLKQFKIGSVSDCNWTQTHNQLVHKQTLNGLAKLATWLVLNDHLISSQLASMAKWLSVRLWINWLWFRFQLQLLRLREKLQGRLSGKFFWIIYSLYLVAIIDKSVFHHENINKQKLRNHK